jgi:hypothetical protein
MRFATIVCPETVASFATVVHAVESGAADGSNAETDETSYAVFTAVGFAYHGTT